MNKLKDITLVGVAGYQNNIIPTLKALLFSFKKLPCYKTLFFCPTIVKDGLWDEYYSLYHQFKSQEPDFGDELSIHTIQTKEFDIRDYNHFIFSEYTNYINTKFALNIQADGFIINEDLWDNKWLKYDYIGAPWNLNNDWIPVTPDTRVGNGGFSLRSKKFLDTCRNLAKTEKSMNDLFYQRNANEDMLFRSYRWYFTMNGCKFAPPDVAAKFSMEERVIENPDFNPARLDTYKSFGFHGKHCLAPLGLIL